MPFRSRSELERLRDRRVRETIQFAARHVPHYREWFSSAPLLPADIRTADDLDQLPLLDREQLRAEPDRFVAEQYSNHNSIAFTTSGTTGQPLTIRHDHRSVLANIAFGERERRVVLDLCGGFRPKELYVGYEDSTFTRATDFVRRATRIPTPPRRTHRSIREPIGEIARASCELRPDVLVGYGGWLELFFRTVEAQGLMFHPPKVVVSVGEALPEGVRALLHEQFGAVVLSRYNAVESFKIGYTCDRSEGFHLHEDLCHLRLVSDRGETVTPGEAGRVVLTNLVNRATILINYPIGDRARDALGQCPCGRNQRQLAKVLGRVEDVIHLGDGQALHPRSVWQQLKGIEGLLQYRLTQFAGSQTFLFEFRSSSGAASDTSSTIRRTAEPRLRDLLGPGAELQLSERTDLRQGRKYRAVQVLGPSDESKGAWSEQPAKRAPAAPPTAP